MLKCISVDPIWIPFGLQQLKFWTTAWYSPVVRDSLLLCVLDSFCSILESLSGSILQVLRSLRCRRSMRPPSRPTANKNTPNLKPRLKTQTRLSFVLSRYAANVPKTYVSWHHVLMSSPFCYIYLFPPHAWHCPSFLPLVLSENSCIRNLMPGIVRNPACLCTPHCPTSCSLYCPTPCCIPNCCAWQNLQLVSPPMPASSDILVPGIVQQIFVSEIVEPANCPIRGHIVWRCFVAG